MGDGPLDALSGAIARFDHVDARLLVLAAVIQLLGSAFHSRAWANLLAAARPESRFPRGAVLCAHLAGVAGNAVVPAHAGDAAKVALIRRMAPGTPIATIVTTLVMLTAVDVALGGTALLATAATSLGPALPHPGTVGLLIPAATVLALGVAALAARRRLPQVLAHVRDGAALLSDPQRFLREAVTWQAGAWLARVGVAFVALHAFGLPASLLDAVLVVVVTGLAGVIPFLPGGVGAQQAMMVYALRKTASAASVVTFGVGLQVGVTLVDLTVGVIALMITFRTLALRSALRAGRQAA
jgi:glycosyltransferase 2 family protein